MASLSFIKSPGDFTKSVVPENRVLEFTGLSDTGVPTPFYKLSDGTIVQLYQAIIDAVLASLPTGGSGSGLSYATFEYVVDNKVTVPGIPSSVILNDKYYTVNDTYIAPVPGTSNWSVDTSKLLALNNATEFDGYITVFYNPVDFIYTPYTPILTQYAEQAEAAAVIANDSVSAINARTVELQELNNLLTTIIG